MKAVNLYGYLSSNEYPGRGIVLGRSIDGRKMLIGYFIMGRSENSRNRVFVTAGEGIRTEAFDPAKLSDPSLIIYSPVRVLGKSTIVTNGDQTDTIYDFMAKGMSFEDALRTRTFEPDGPNFTPRISGTVCGAGYQLSILKSAGGNPNAVHRFFFDYTDALPGQGHVIHTYRENGNPIPSFEGEPVLVEMADGFDAFGEKLWDALNKENKVSLFVRAIDLATGKTETGIYNKNK
ncbi:MAG: IMP cyclohydrolase [Oscillospiraceae bacterium]|nr:IMP cyclohydrolase [Oscillospiraceae bacterium]